MKMDADQSRVEKAIDDYRAVTGNHDLDDSWDAVRTQCYESCSTYLSLTTEGAALDSVHRGTELLRASTEQIAAFQTRHSQRLNTGAAAVATITAAVEQAQNAANQSRSTRTGTYDFSSYPSVRTAKDQLDQAYTRLMGARSTRDYPTMKATAAQVTAAAARFDAALRAAPDLANNAERALSSTSTRLSSARTRLEGVAPALSALLREFAAASSSDLFDNEAAAREHIDEAADSFARARSAQYRGDPEEALALIGQVRAALGAADQLIDAVPNRLRMLHEIRDDPKKISEPARFALHDAQMLALSGNSTATQRQQWASVLDAQLHRIESLEKALNTPHPDYWGYTVGLDRVTEFIRTTVLRMRDSIGKARAP